jgi:PPP family 3-phenylpropionic acid transporter
MPIFWACITYVAIFSASGLNQPYLPIWLGARRLTDTEIAVVLSAPLLLRVFVTPAIGALADQVRDRNRVVRVLALLVLVIALALSQATGFWAILVLATAMMLSSQSIVPVVDASVLSLVRNGIARDFGRIRLWGSMSFAAASILGGFVLSWGGPDAVFGAFMAATGLLVAASFVLPQTASASPGQEGASLRLFRRPLLLVVFLAAALVLASHATFNSFGSIQLRSTGYPEWSIGMLWAVATSAEIAMFWAGPTVARVLGPYWTLLLAAGAGFFRWSFMAYAPGFAATLLLQLLHAATFSGSYLGLMRFVETEVADQVGARAQSAFVTMLGIMTAATTLAMGPLYRHFGSGAFQITALLPLMALILLLAFRLPLCAVIARSTHGLRT